MGIQGRTGHGVDIAVLFQGETGGDQAAGTTGRFHHKNAQSKAADDPVADGKMFGQGRRAGGKFRKQQALLRHGAEKRLPGTGIDLVNARSQNSDAAPHTGQGSLVGHAVDSLAPCRKQR